MHRKPRIRLITIRTTIRRLPESDTAADIRTETLVSIFRHDSWQNPRLHYKPSPASCRRLEAIAHDPHHLHRLLIAREDNEAYIYINEGPLSVASAAARDKRHKNT